MNDSIKRWTAKREIALVVRSSKATVAEARRAYDLSPPRSRAGTEHLMCLGSAIDTPSPLPARIGDGVGYSAEHLVA